MLSDIQNRTDVENLVNTFYEKVRADATIGMIFNEVAHVDWPSHLPKMYDFWESILFGTGQYRGRPMPPHFKLNEHHPFKPEYFDAWLALFYQTVDELFEGEKATEAKVRAVNIAAVMEHRINQINEGATASLLHRDQ
ncbi:group III truncated hemoglobin [Arundinibacter roseus]|uniref:Group III truncated hemoglobin n=1 Tax=Arundinibacter roseus TaxID=2070510 RepID=A0A4R4K7V7_9BACT|nr:group III truncated hemoglobin [Arundinibacter roseus]TDB63610.1 group III truncated hemoglobin [Arundinibacter roseus]